MRTTLCFALLLAAGCARHSPAPAGPSHPDLTCPEGTIPTGAVPPDGLEAWCQRVNERGEWSKEGPYLRWHENHQKAEQGLYKNNQRTGPWTFWYETGQVAKQGSYKGGVEDGFWTTFHPNGQRASEGQMVSGKEHGPWVYWTEDGQQRTEGRWELGKREGTWTVYDATDTPISEIIYRGGRQLSKREL